MAHVVIIYILPLPFLFLPFLSPHATGLFSSALLLTTLTVTFSSYSDCCQAFCFPFCLLGAFSLFTPRL